MFINKNQLRHLLTPEHYVSETQYRDELEHLFGPAWHLVGTMRDLARPGNFITLDLLGHPLLVRNMDGTLRAFLNVCSHRHCRITNRRRGSSPRLRCQYHGWEYTAEGRTARIPDAQSFRPFDRENSCLKTFRVATCGALVFVNLIDDGPTLDEFLGPNHALWLESFGSDYQLAGAWSREFPCNWKVVVENSLESYHIPCVHPKTFGRYPREELCAHVLDERFTTFRADRSNLRENLTRRIRRWGLRRLGAAATFTYEHQNIHPHLTFSGGDFHRIAMVVYPLSSTTCRYSYYAFSLRGARGGPLAPVLAPLLRTIVARATRRVFLEDASIYASVQQGLAASPHPGVIGTREERIYAFQDYVARLGQGATVAPQVD